MNGDNANVGGWWKQDTMGTDFARGMANATWESGRIAIDADGATFKGSGSGGLNVSGVVYGVLALGDDGSGDIVCSTYTGTGSTHTETVSGITQIDFLIVGAGVNGLSSIYTQSTLTDDQHWIANGAYATSSAFINNRTATTFDVGTNSTVNSNGQPYHVLALKNVTGYVKVFDYTGDGNDDRTINLSLGFTPTDCLIKPNRASNAGMKFQYQAGVDANYFLSNGTVVSNEIQDFASDGFVLGSGTRVNELNTANHGIAFKEVSTTVPAASGGRPRPILID